MSDQCKSLRFKHTAALLAAGILLMACSLPLSLPGVDTSGTPTPTPTMKIGQEGPEGATPEPLVACPDYGMQATLTFDHDIDWGIEGAGKFGVAVKGSYQIHVVKSDVVHDPESMEGIYNLGKGPFLVTVSVTGFEDCTDGENETTMRAIVTGTCIDSTLTLNIEEVYEPASVKIMCDDDLVDIPVPLSAFLAPVTWSMPISTLSGAGADKHVPFMGMGGGGEFFYNLTLP